MNKKNWYLFMGRIALEYRLSLNGICELLNMEKTEENRQEIYETIMSSESTSSASKEMYKYLFNYETLLCDEETEKEAIIKAGKFLRSYILAKKTNNDELVQQLLNSLNNTEIEFKKIQKKDFSEYLSEEDVLTISKYRIKHCVSRRAMSDIIGVYRDRLANSEKKLSDKTVCDKLELLSKYYQDLESKKFRGK